MKKLILLFALVCLSGCMPAPWPSSDPFGVTQRAQMRADVDTVRAQAERDARIKVAEANASAVIGVAREQADAEIARSNAWARAVPFTVFIIVAGIAVCLLINWQGRIYFERTRQPAQVRQVQRLSSVPPSVILEANRRGGIPKLDGDTWLIVHPETGKSLAKQRKQLTG